MREGEVCNYVWRSVKKEGEVEKRTMDTERERESKRQSERKYSSHGEESVCHSERERETDRVEVWSSTDSSEGSSISKYTIQ